MLGRLGLGFHLDRFPGEWMSQSMMGHDEMRLTRFESYNQPVNHSAKNSTKKTLILAPTRHINIDPSPNAILQPSNRRPITKHEALEAQLTLQHISKHLLTLARPDLVDAVICTHYTAYTRAHGFGEGP